MLHTNQDQITFLQIPSGVATANQLSLIPTDGVAEILTLPDTTLFFVGTGDQHGGTPT